jgi:hypothetical protein
MSQHPVHTAASLATTVIVYSQSPVSLSSFIPFVLCLTSFTGTSTQLPCYSRYQRRRRLTDPPPSHTLGTKPRTRQRLYQHIAFPDPFSFGSSGHYALRTTYYGDYRGRCHGQSIDKHHLCVSQVRPVLVQFITLQCLVISSTWMLL